MLLTPSVSEDEMVNIYSKWPAKKLLKLINGYSKQNKSAAIALFQQQSKEAQHAQEQLLLQWHTTPFQPLLSAQELVKSLSSGKKSFTYFLLASLLLVKITKEGLRLPRTLELSLSGSSFALRPDLITLLQASLPKHCLGSEFISLFSKFTSYFSTLVDSNYSYYSKFIEDGDHFDFSWSFEQLKSLSRRLTTKEASFFLEPIFARIEKKEPFTIRELLILQILSCQLTRQQVAKLLSALITNLENADHETQWHCLMLLHVLPVDFVDKDSVKLLAEKLITEERLNPENLFRTSSFSSRICRAILINLPLLTSGQSLNEAQINSLLTLLNFNYTLTDQSDVIYSDIICIAAPALYPFLPKLSSAQCDTLIDKLIRFLNVAADDVCAAIVKLLKVLPEDKVIPKMEAMFFSQSDLLPITLTVLNKSRRDEMIALQIPNLKKDFNSSYNVLMGFRNELAHSPSIEPLLDCLFEVVCREVNALVLIEPLIAHIKDPHLTTLLGLLNNPSPSVELWSILQELIENNRLTEKQINIIRARIFSGLPNDSKKFIEANEVPVLNMLATIANYLNEKQVEDIRLPVLRTLQYGSEDNIKAASNLITALIIHGKIDSQVFPADDNDYPSLEFKLLRFMSTVYPKLCSKINRDEELASRNRIL